ncbi:MAG: Efflux ABC transporter, ATP-binding protein, partial [uncultured Blastococcus sp.]
ALGWDHPRRPRRATSTRRHHLHPQHRDGRPRPGRGTRTEQVLRPGACGHRPRLHRRAGIGDRLPGPQRRRQDHHAAHAARADAARRRHRDLQRGPLHRAAGSPAHRRGGARDRLPPGPDRTQPPARLLPRRRSPAVPGRRGPGAGRAGRRRQPPRRRLLPRHAAAARAGHRPARRPRRPRPGRARQRPGPRGHPVAARLPPAHGPRPGPHGAGLQPPAVRGRADRRPGGHRRCRTARPRGLHGAAALGCRRRGHGARPGPGRRPARGGTARRRRRGHPGGRHPDRARDHARRRGPPGVRHRRRAARAALTHQRARGDLLPAHQRLRAVRRSLSHRSGGLPM